MKTCYETFGNLAIAPRFAEADRSIVTITPCGREFGDAAEWDLPLQSSVEETLDDFDGRPFATTSSDRRFAAVALAAAAFLTFFFSFAPIF